MFTDPQRLVRRNAARRALLGRPSRVDRDKVRSLSLALVLLPNGGNLYSKDIKIKARKAYI